MIHLHIAMARQLRAFLETANIPWNPATAQYGDGGRVNATFQFNSKRVEAYIVPPAQDQGDRFNGELLPHGRLACRINGGTGDHRPN
jgi:hypothetical protein